MDRNRSSIVNGEAVLGIELGSTRIKAVLLDKELQVIASGSFAWESRLADGIWTYSLEEVWDGIERCYADLKKSVCNRYGVVLQKVAAAGISGMMHGYLAFDQKEELLTPFRTWRNINAHKAAVTLSEKLCFNIPDRWSIAHLYQSILEEEEHVQNIRYMTTLAGYVHWKLSGEKVLGIGDASGMFPIDADKKAYREKCLSEFEDMIKDKKYPWKIKDLLPRVLCAGECAGRLSAEGARLIDPEGDLEAGCMLCPPEGDAGTGMVATNSVAVRTGNVSAGTSIFAMLVLEKELSKPYREVDMVTTPEGHAVAMVHANNCTSDINAWVKLFDECLRIFGCETDSERLFSSLFQKAMEAEADGGGLLSYGYLAGESITEMEEGRPLFVRKPGANFTLANFMRTHLYSAFATLRIGMDILTKNEYIKIDKLYGHGGIFKTEAVGQKLMAASLNMPVSVMENAGEGGPWGEAALAAYMIYGREGEKLPEFLENNFFSKSSEILAAPDSMAVEGFKRFLEAYIQGIEIEKTAIKVF